MKTSRLLAAGLLLMAAVPVMGQGNGSRGTADISYFGAVSNYGKTNVQRAKALYLANTRSANCGVAESALAHLVHMRIALPQEDMRDVECALLDLAKDGSTHTVRSRAFIARLVFSNPEAFRDVIDGTYASGDEFFEAIARRLEPSL